MTETELKKLNRGELLEMLVLQSEENQKLKERIEELEQELSERAIAVSESGTLAEAALRLNRVFEAADRAVEQYKENICRMHHDQAAIAKAKIAEAEEQAADIRMQARLQAEKSKSEADAYWQSLAARLEAFYREHQGLKEMLEAVGGSQTR